MKLRRTTLGVEALIRQRLGPWQALHHFPILRET